MNLTLFIAILSIMSGGIAALVLIVRKRRGVVILQHGCRSGFGPLELRIQSGASRNGFIVFVEDPRRADRTVYEQTVRSSLASAQAYVVLRAQEYLSSFNQPDDHNADWRCS